MEEDILATERELQRAVLASDVAALDRILADDVLYIGPDGARSDKAADLRLIRTGAVVFTGLEASETEIHIVSPEVAILRVRLKLGLVVHLQAIEGAYRYLRLYAKRQGRWQVVFAQTHVD